jgi:ketosteroid isomerase-like protein
MTLSQSTTAAADVVERMLHEGFEAGNADIVDELCAPDLIEHQFGLSGVGPTAIEKLKLGIQTVHAAFSDLRFTVADVAQNGDTVWIRAEVTGTHTGPFIGPPTGKTVHFTVIDVATVRDGRIVEHWGVPDRFAILAQTGQLGRPAV